MVRGGADFVDRWVDFVEKAMISYAFVKSEMSQQLFDCSTSW